MSKKAKYGPNTAEVERMLDRLRRARIGATGLCSRATTWSTRT